MKNSIDNYIKRFEIEKEENWREITKDIPTLHFDKEWEVKIIPPFSGAIARFIIMKDDKQICSIYLDWYGKLGAMDEPYYELYPFENDVRRYLLNETEDMMNDIRILFSSDGVSSVVDYGRLRNELL